MFQILGALNEKALPTNAFGGMGAFKEMLADDRRVLVGSKNISSLTANQYVFHALTSMNPELDIGQAEGGFVMGLGYFLLEELVYNPKDGMIMNASTWVSTGRLQRLTNFKFGIAS